MGLGKRRCFGLLVELRAGIKIICCGEKVYQMIKKMPVLTFLWVDLPFDSRVSGFVGHWHKNKNHNKQGVRATLNLIFFIWHEIWMFLNMQPLIW
jgi:hypothetical protein